jgi:hypothetical protein
MIYKTNVKGFQFKEIRKNKKELTECKDYLPYTIRFTAFTTLTDINQRKQFLKKQDLYEDYQKENKKRSNEYSILKNNTQRNDYLINEVLEFVNNNKGYDDFIIQ